MHWAKVDWGQVLYCEQIIVLILCVSKDTTMCRKVPWLPENCAGLIDTIISKKNIKF